MAKGQGGKRTKKTFEKVSDIMTRTEGRREIYTMSQIYDSIYYVFFYQGLDSKDGNIRYGKISPL